MLLAEKVLENVKMCLGLYRCCVTSWNGRCCEFPMDMKKPAPTKGFLSRLFNTQTEAPITNQIDRSGHHNAVEIKQEFRVPSYRVLGNRVVNHKNPNSNQWWALFG